MSGKTALMSIPGSVDTSISNVVGNHEEQQLFLDKLTKTIRLEWVTLWRLPTPVLFLATDESFFIQGGETVIDGGATTVPRGRGSITKNYK
jgi:hypothetical protein